MFHIHPWIISHLLTCRSIHLRVIPLLLRLRAFPFLSRQHVIQPSEFTSNVEFLVRTSVSQSLFVDQLCPGSPFTLRLNSSLLRQRVVVTNCANFISIDLHSFHLKCASEITSCTAFNGPCALYTLKSFFHGLWWCRMIRKSENLLNMILCDETLSISFHNKSSVEPIQTLKKPVGVALWMFLNVPHAGLKHLRLS